MIYIKEKIDKAEVAEMEVVTFGGRIIVIQTEAEAEKAVNYLLANPIVGLDTETRILDAPIVAKFTRISFRDDVEY